MMKQTTKRLLLSMAALILSVGAVCTSYAASDKRKVGKMDLVFDSDLGIGAAGNSYSVTVDGANTDRYYISDTEVVNEDSDDFSDSNPPEIEVTLAVADDIKLVDWLQQRLGLLEQRDTAMLHRLLHDIEKNITK